jgi:superfamily II DNA or RNA helicase
VSNFLTFYQSLSDAANLRGKQFEHFVKWFLVNDPEWSTQVSQVWLWEEFPQRWGPDCGIDLVFQHKNGELWAVQAKCYSAAYDITKHDVDKFLSESNRNLISKRLLIATTDGIGNNAVKVCDAQEKPVVRFLLSNFERAKIEYPSSFEHLSQSKRKAPPSPREHQLEAIEAVASGMKNSDRGQLIMACGTGKTFTTLWIKEKLNARKVLVLVPSLSLLAQTLREWTFAAEQPFDVFCICSDQSVGKRESDEIVTSVGEVSFPVTSSVDEIKHFLKSEVPQVVFCTYQSSTLIEQAHLDLNIPSFDLVVADEAHRCTGRVGTDFTTVLNNSKIRSIKRLFTTATPRTYSSLIKRGAEDLGVEVVGMDDEEVFGPVLHTLSFHEAINRKLLTDYRVIIIGVDDPMVASLIKTRTLVLRKDGITSDAEAIASQVGLLKAIKDYDLSKMISFHGRVSRAENFAKEIQNLLPLLETEIKPSGSLWADVVSGDMPTNRRKVKLDQLKNSNLTNRGLLTNARCLSEGIDVPSLDGVAFIDPRSSQVDIIQAVGRAIRKSEDKTFGTIVLPVFIRNEDDPSVAIESSNFKPIWDVINALKAHDQDLALELEQLRTEMGKHSVTGMKVEGLKKIHFDLPIKFDDKFTSQLKTRLVEQTTATWDYWFGLLIAWRQLYKDDVPEVLAEFSDKKIGIWVATQRTNFQKGILQKRRIQLLESLSGWSWDRVEDLWIQGLNALKEFHNEHSHFSPPENYTSQSGVKLGSWVKTRRLDYSRGKLRQDKVNILEALSGWSWDPSADYWKSNFNKISAAVNSCALVEIEKGRTKNNNFKQLAAWINAQKRNYRAWSNVTGSDRPKYPQLTPEQISLLEGIEGWSWDRKTDSWMRNFSQLQDYLLKNDFDSVNPSTSHNGLVIGRWVTKQRAIHKSGKLEQWKLKKLDSLSWVADPFKKQWDESFALVEEFAAETGSAYVPQGTRIKGVHIGRWVSSQRIDNKAGQLSQDRICKLESLNGWLWDASDQSASAISKSGLSPSKLKSKNDHK